MGAGIAQVAAAAGEEVFLYDVTPAAVSAGLDRIRQSLSALERKGRIPPGATEQTLGRIQIVASLQDLAPSDLVVEAAPESLEIKRHVFEALDACCAPDAILATNTSSLPVTVIGAMTKRPERVIGLHFFNPAPLMKLVEVVRGTLTDESAVQTCAGLATAWGKTAVVVADTPGFLVNRVARPFVGEAMRIAGEGIARPAQIDRIARLGAGFRMGPFELMDLIGQDVNFAVNRSVWEQYYYEPRLRPHPSQEKLLQAGLLGRKAGRGWYRYRDGAPVDGPEGHRFQEAPGARVELTGPVVVAGDAPEAAHWRVRLGAAGYTVSDEGAAELAIYFGSLDGLTACEERLAPGALLLVEASAISLLQAVRVLKHPHRMAGFGGLLNGGLVEIAPLPGSPGDAVGRAASFLAGLGLDSEVIEWSPGMVGARIVAMLANEAFFAWQEGVAGRTGIDLAMQLGVNYPAGPIAWARQIGLGRICAILRCLQDTYGEDRYRVCPLLMREATVRGERS